MRSGDVALRLSIVFSVAGFIALAASLYEVDRREKSNSATAGSISSRLSSRSKSLAIKSAFSAINWAPTSDRLSCSAAKSKPSICG